MNKIKSKKGLGILITLVVLVSAFALAMATPPAGAGSENSATHRPIEDFLDTQGTFWDHRYFITWADNEITCYTKIDYAGLDCEWIYTRTSGEIDLGTEISGSITERPLVDGRTMVHLVVHTKNALAWVRSYTYPWPVIFGSYPVWVTDYDWPAALVDCTLDFKYITPAEPGEPIPDLFQLVYFPEEGQEIVQARFTASGKGHLNSGFGVEPFTPGMMQITQKAPFNAPGMWKSGNHMPDAWPVGNIQVKVVGN